MTWTVKLNITMKSDTLMALLLESTRIMIKKEIPYMWNTSQMIQVMGGYLN